MYTYVRAFGKQQKYGSRWKLIDVKNTLLKDIFSLYKSIYVVLTNSFFNGEIGFDLENIKTTHYHSNLTFNQYLQWLENTALTHMTSVPTIDTKQVKYADAYHAGYKIKPIHRTASIDSDLPNSEKNYLLLNKKGLDYSDFYKHCLVSVNGYFHLTDYDTTAAYVVDGNRSAKISKNTNIGIYSFKELGSLEQIPITESMISQQLNEIPLKEKCYIKLNKKIDNKIPILILGGYMHIFDDSTFYMVDESTICINFMNYRFLDRYYESIKHIDLSSLNFGKYDRNDTQIAMEEVYSDSVIKAYLTLNQSFIVLLDAEDIFVERVAINSSNMPGMLVTHLKPQYPLVGGYGKMIEYWYTFEDRQYSITCVDDLIDMRLYNTTEYKDLLSVSDHRIPTDRVRKSYAYFLNIGKDISSI